MKGSPRDGRKISHLSERDRWEMFRGSPDPRLRGHVLAYCDYDERTASFTRRRELPSDRVVLIVNLGAPIRVSPRGRPPLSSGRRGSSRG